MLSIALLLLFYLNFILLILLHLFLFSVHFIMLFFLLCEIIFFIMYYCDAFPQFPLVIKKLKLYCLCACVVLLLGSCCSVFSWQTESSGMAVTSDSTDIKTGLQRRTAVCLCTWFLFRHPWWSVFCAVHLFTSHSSSRKYRRYAIFTVYDFLC